MSQAVVGEEISFRYVWQMELLNAYTTQHEAAYFSTIYGPTNYEWGLTCGRMRSMRFFRGTRGAVTEHMLSVEHTSRMGPSRTPHPIDCTFTMRLIDKKTYEDVLQPVTQVIVPNNTGHWFDTCAFRTSKESPLGEMLRNIFDKTNNAGKTIEVVSVIRFPSSDFELSLEYHRIALPPPKKLDFRFNCITDTTRHDFTIVCRDGRATYPKDALFHVSPYFKELLIREDIGSEITEDVPMTVVKQVLNFMLTDTFEHEGVMNEEHVRQLQTIVAKYLPPNRMILKNAMEKHLLIQLGKCTNDLEAVVRLYLLGSEFEMGRLLYSALCFIAATHYGQFALDYGAQTPDNSQNLALIEQLARRVALFRPAPITRITQVRRSMENVTVFRRQLQAKVE